MLPIQTLIMQLVAELVISRTVDTQLKTHNHFNTEDIRIEKHGKTKRPPRQNRPEMEKPLELSGLPRSHHPQSHEPGGMGMRWWRDPGGPGLAHPSPAFPKHSFGVFKYHQGHYTSQGRNTHIKHLLWPTLTNSHWPLWFLPPDFPSQRTPLNNQMWDAVNFTIPSTWRVITQV